MTGIERLRELSDGIDGNLETVSATRLSYGRRHKSDSGGRLRYLLSDITNQIEREERRHERGQRVSRMRVKAVLADMEHHVLGHEGMEDSPVARWARELRGALKSDASDGSEAQSPSCADAAETADVTSEDRKVTRDHAEDVSMSAYDLLSSDERNAIAWVRDHGGIDYVKREWRSRVPCDRYVRKRQRLLGHIAECETALGRRNQRIEELGKHIQSLMTENADMRKRLMPDGMEWPTVDGKPVDFVTGYEPSIGVLEAVSIYSNGACEVMGHDGIIKGVKEIHVATPKVLDADGVDTSVGDTVYEVDTGEKMWVCALPEQGAYQCVKLRLINGTFKTLDPCRFTHERPDSLDRLAEDIGAMVVAWRSNKDLFDAQWAAAGCVGENTMGAALDSLVRRIKALAGDA